MCSTILHEFHSITMQNCTLIIICYNYCKNFIYFCSVKSILNTVWMDIITECLCYFICVPCCSISIELRTLFRWTNFNYNKPHWNRRWLTFHRNETVSFMIRCIRLSCSCHVKMTQLIIGKVSKICNWFATHLNRIGYRIIQ